MTSPTETENTGTTDNPPDAEKDRAADKDRTVAPGEGTAETVEGGTAGEAPAAEESSSAAATEGETPAEGGTDGEEGEEKDESLGTTSTMEKSGPCKQRIKAEVPSQKVVEELDRNYKELISSVQIPGFRRGHVPRRLIEKRYGTEIEGDVKELLLGLSFQEVVKEKELKVIGKPKFENVAFSKEEPLRYEVEVEVQPDFQVSGYEGIEVEVVGEDKAPPVTPESVDTQVERLRKKFPELEAIDPAQAGPADFFLGHYVLVRDGNRVHTKDEVRFQPEANVLDGFPIPDLAAKVTSRGDSPTFTAHVTVPDHYPAEVLRGKEVDLEFTIEEARKVRFPEVDDAFAQRCGSESLADLRARIEKELEAGRKIQVEGILEDRILTKIESGVEFELPEGFLEEQVKMKRLRQELSMIQEGFGREEIDAALKKLDETAAADLRKELKRFFILEKVAEMEKIFATEDDVDAQVGLLAKAYRRPAGEVVEELEESGRLDTLRAEIRHTKVLRFLREKAKVAGAAEGAAPAGETAAGQAGEGAPGG